MKDFFCHRATELLASGTSGRLIVYGLSRHMDNILSDTYREVVKGSTVPAESDGIAILGVGGYGRSELFPFSDVDILILSREDNGRSREAAQAILYALWDKGIDISHSFRTVAQCAKDAMGDITTRTSLLESRFIAGSKELYASFLSDAHQKIVFKNRKNFVVDILREIEKRHKHFGDSIYLLEPNIKEGHGGLRDVHSISWLLKVVHRLKGLEDCRRFFSAQDYTNFMRACDYIVKMRVALHCASGRKNEVLSFDLQEDVARHFRLTQTSRLHPAEIMMRIYFGRARTISYALQHVKEMGSRIFTFPSLWGFRRITNDFYLHKNEIVIKNSAIFKSPDKVIEAFYVFSTVRNRFSHQVKNLIRTHARQIVRKEPLSPAAKRLFLKILSGNRLFETLYEMHDCAVLERVIPEFSRLRHLVIYEPSHRYTVDIHSLMALRHLEELRGSRDEKDADLREILDASDQTSLVLTILLHDIGKGVSRDHSEEGYHLIKGILERFDLDHEDVKRIELLVRNHVVLSKLALTRDIDAPETILQLADVVGDERTLNALYLITHADMKALSPGYLSDWKSSLLRELYLKTRDHLRGVTAEVMQFSDAGMGDFLREMPKRYRVSSTREMIQRDYRLFRRLDTECLGLSVQENPDRSAELTIVTHDRPGLFSAIANALSLKNLDVKRARLFTGTSGTVVDRILVSNWKDLWWEGLLDEIRNCLIDTVGSPNTLPEVLDKDHDLQAHQETAGPPLRFKRLIEIDNEGSERSSIVELLLPDRPGLLRAITRVLSTMDLNILAAVINTEDAVAHDVFYVRKDGGKLDDRSTLALIDALQTVKYPRSVVAHASR